MAEFSFIVSSSASLSPELRRVLETAAAELETAGQRRDDQPVPLQVEDHCAVATGRLLQYLQNKPNLEALLCEFLDPLNDLETAFFQLLNERTVDAAVGAQLDGIGEIVGETRDGRSDADYRRILKVRLLVLRSNGKREELLQILTTLLGSGVTILASEIYPAGLIYEIVEELTEDVDDVARFLGDAKGGGIRLYFKYALSPETDTFAFSSQTNAIDTSSTRGFANAAQSTGGHLIGVRLAV